MAERNYFLLFYDVVDDYVERRGQYRKEHLTLAQEYVDRGELVLGGAYEDPANGAALVFYVVDSQRVEQFVKEDPYVRSGLVKKWTVRKYKVVLGTACENPICLAGI